MIFDQGHDLLAVIPIKGFVKSHILQSCKNKKVAEELCEHEQAICITSKDGRIHTCDAGIDGSNHPPDIVSFLPGDPDAAALVIRQQIQSLCGKKVAVILADTEMVYFGTIDLAVGSSGISPLSNNFGEKDLYGKAKFGGIDIIAYELTAAAGLLFGQTSAGIAAAVVRGYDYEIDEQRNISNTLMAWKKDSGLTEMIKDAMRATSCTCKWKKRLLLRIGSIFF
ncbi:MAG: coenzyme F420-0:L-glutamate ligase [Sedimentisphaerales bacterium]|nr:coenzyme F420-0:L-glutamate ligase [Sedimentisphaerales bacterium]